MLDINVLFGNGSSASQNVADPQISLLNKTWNEYKFRYTFSWKSKNNVALLECNRPATFHYYYYYYYYANNSKSNICDATCQNQALLAKMGFWVVVLFNKRVSIAFIWYIIHVSKTYQSKAMCISKCFCTWHLQNHWTEKKAAKSWNFTWF